MTCDPNATVIDGVWLWLFILMLIAFGYILGAASSKRRGQDVAERLARLDALKNNQYVTPTITRMIKQRLREFHNINRAQPGLPIYVEPTDAYLLIADAIEISNQASPDQPRDAEIVFAKWLNSTPEFVEFRLYGHPVLPKREDV